MKIAVISDTHGETDECIDILKNIKGLDMILHLGDFCEDAKKIKNEIDIKLINVKGNCDFNENHIRDEEIIKVNDKKIFLTHGHKYKVKSNINHIFYKAKELDVDIALFGHSHIPMALVEENILFLNPGSISFPRGGYNKSYAIINIENVITHDIIYV